MDIPVWDWKLKGDSREEDPLRNAFGLALVALLAMASCDRKGGLDDRANDAGAGCGDDCAEPGGGSDGGPTAADGGNGATTGTGANAGSGAATAGSIGTGGNGGAAGDSGGEPTAGSSMDIGGGGQGGTPSGGAGAPDPGQAGAAGTPGTVEPECGPLLDDFEDGNDQICVGEGRSATWYCWKVGGTTSPGCAAGQVVPIFLSPERATSTRAMHYGGTGTTLAGIGFPFSQLSSATITYDASQYSGIEFYALATTSLGVGVILQTQDTDGVAYGGSCSSNCKGNEYAMSFPTSWTKIQIPFSSFVGGNATVNPAKLRSLTFQTGGNYELWIDDISFY